MDYEKIYTSLITYRQQNVLSKGYIEKHHIIPRSLGGTDNKTNLVALTGREHYVAHLLLARFNRCSQTAYALWMMQMKNSKDSSRPCIKSGRMYEWARKEFAKYTSRNNMISSKGERNSQYGTCWICNLELRENRKVNKDEPIPEGWTAGRNKWNNRVKKPRPPCSESTKQKISDKNKISKIGNKSLTDMIWINNGLLNKVIHKDNLIPIDFKKGKIFTGLV